MPRARSLVAGAVLALGAAACAGSAGIDEFAAETTTTEPGSSASPETAGAEPVVAPGVIVAGGSPLQLLDSTGEVVAGELSAVGLQPTWSRDGSRLIAAVSSSGGFGVAVYDPTGTLVDDPSLGAPLSPAPFFFFSWSHDGTRVAALGPGRFGTSLAVLDDDGLNRSATRLEGGSVFVAWEPGGERLLAHSDGELLVLEPSDGGYEPRALGLPGVRFYAPKWIPGTSEILYVDDEGRLVRHDVDTAATDDLGPTRGATAISVHPDGGRAVLTHTPGSLEADGGILPAAFQTDVSATVEEVDLATGARVPVADGLGLWAEWSPDGDRLLLATLSGDPHAEWWLWDGTELTHVTTWIPTSAFFSRYMVFADQYVEQPRLWAPDSAAFVYPSVVSDDDLGPVDRILVVAAQADARPSVIGTGSVGFWSPAAPTP